jgi:type IV pilus assembly protein PilE
MKNRQFQQRVNAQEPGFTMIELVIAMVIIGVLAAIALPIYSQHVQKGNRAAAESAMMDMANLEQQYFLANRGYTSSTSTLGYTLPSTVSAKYTAAINVTSNNSLDSACALATNGSVPSFAIVMTPISGGSQVSDGTIYLDSVGTKCPTTKW